MTIRRGRPSGQKARGQRSFSAPRALRSARSPEQFSDLFENARDVIVLNDREGRIVAANRAARELGEYSAEDVVRGVYLSDVLPPDDCAAALLLTQRAFDGLPVPEVYEREVMSRSGDRRVLELRSNLLHRRGRPYALQTIGRDVTDAKEAAAFQASLLQVSQALLTAQTLDELGRVICEEAGRVLDVDGTYLWLRRGDEMIGCAAAGRAAQEIAGLRRPLGSSLIGEMYRAADMLVVNDFPHSLYAATETTMAEALGVQSMLAMPLRRSAMAAGVLVFIDSVNPRRFTSLLRDRAVIFGAQTTVAIESALAREREEEEGRVSAALLHVTRAIRGSLEERDVLRGIARSTREVLPCDAVVVLLWNPESEAFRAAAIEGMPPAIAGEIEVIDFRPDTLEGLKRLLVRETLEIAAPRPGRLELAQRWSISSMLAVPMARPDHLVGAISVSFRERRGPFSARERRIAEGIAVQAAIAVDNARLVRDLRRANEMKSEFLGTMSHELRTPLNAILGYTELLHDGAMGPVNDEQIDVLDRMLINGRGLLELINMTLNVNRLEAGRDSLHAREFGLSDLVAEVHNEFGLRASDDLALSWPDVATLPRLYTDHDKLKAVLRNLVDNALKFTPRGSVAVAAEWAREADRIRLSVRDTGIGIPRSALTSIFEMFRQVNSHTSARGGVGLGLYLVRRYAEMLGGSVTVESTPGEGSTFTVEIPRTVSRSE
jgi:PAS domain S-box-containing protein